MKLSAAKKYIKVFLLTLRGNTMQRMAHRFNFVFLCFGASVQMLISIVFIKVIFSFLNNLAGWSFNEALVVVASYMTIEGLIWATCAYLGGLRVNIREGTLDGMIARPMSTLFLTSIDRADPEDWVRVITGIFTLIYALDGLNIAAAELAANSVIYIILIINACIILFSISLFLNSISFWIIDGRGVSGIATAITQVSQYPADIFFHKIARAIFSTIIPIAFIATVPAKILLNGFDFKLVGYSFIITFIFAVSAGKFWQFALKHYSSASS